MTTGKSDENQKSEFNRKLSNPAGKGPWLSVLIGIRQTDTESTT